MGGGSGRCCSLELTASSYLSPVRFNDANRRDFFRQGFDEWGKRLLEQTEDRIIQQKYFRPPGALPEMAFLATCTRCGACEPVCPPHAIQPVPTSGGLAAGTPSLDPRSQPCIVCLDMPCVKACPTGALTLPRIPMAGIHRFFSPKVRYPFKLIHS